MPIMPKTRGRVPKLLAEAKVRTIDHDQTSFHMLSVAPDTDDRAFGSYRCIKRSHVRRRNGNADSHRFSH